MEIKWDDRGLAPAIVQDSRTGAVLMLAWMNARSLALTQQTGETHFWSRSRQALWHKGETSGHVQRVDEIRVDCDGDAILVLVTPAGPACHTGETSCFFQRMKAENDPARFHGSPNGTVRGDPALFHGSSNGTVRGDPARFHGSSNGTVRGEGGNESGPGV